MSWKDDRGTWRGGTPPGGLPEHLLHLERRRPTAHAVYLTSELDDGVSGETQGETLAEAQERRRRRHAEQEAAWLSEAQACEALGLDAAALYRDVELLVGCQMQGTELMFDAATVSERLAARASNDDARRRADELPDELRRQGLEVPPWLGGGGAA